MTSSRTVALLLMFMLLGACSENSTPVTRAPDSADTPSALPTQSTIYSAEAFYQTTSFVLPSTQAWSYDDSKLLIGNDATGTFNVYSLDPASGATTALTGSNLNSQFPVSWFPKDERVLVRADSGGNELHHIYVRETNGDLKDLTPGDEVRAGFSGWSDDQQYIYLTTTERDPQYPDIYRYATADYTREMIFENKAGWTLGGISSDGRYLVLAKTHSSADNDLYLLDLNNSDHDPLHITPHNGNVSHAIYSYTPENDGLIYGTNEHGEFTTAWRYDFSTGERTPLLQPDWDVVFVAYSDSGKYRVHGINEDSRIVVSITNTTSGDRVALGDLPVGNLANVRFARDETKLVLALSTDTSPRDLYVIDLSSQNTKRLTTALNPAIDESNLVDSEVIRFASYDDLEIPGVLFRPQSASAEQPVPALVFVHGGPGGQSMTGYSSMFQHLVNHGYAVFAVNNRGSSGYGKTFYHLDDKRHGEVDLDDVVAAGEYLAQLDWIDADKVGVMGGSYGGYMVGAALAFRPDAFKVGVNIFGVMNWVRTLESIPPWWAANRDALYDELGDPATDGDRLRRISPLFHADNINVPLLVVQGANDPRVLKVESDEIVAAVRANEVPVEYLVFDDEGHGFSKRDNRIAASNAYVEFLDKHLKGL